MTMQTNVDPRFTLDFPDRLLLAQRRSGIGVQELADRLEVSRNAISSWINGRNRPRPRDLKAFALATGYPVRWLETGEMPVDGQPDGGGSAVTHRYRTFPQLRLAAVAA
jgi:transcriptional regulator with XRE-family HTH domain